MKSNLPFFSAVIPVYNKGPHVSRAIRSVLEQTCQDFELLLINDASTDESLEEMQKFTDPRIQILQFDKINVGEYAARNLGIRGAKAKWIAFLDADDEWYPEHLKNMRELIQRYPNIKFFSCGWETRNEEERKQDAYSMENMQSGCHEINCQQFLSQFLRQRRLVCCDVAVVSKDAPFLPYLFPEKSRGKRGGDTYTWFKLICTLKKMAWSPHVGAIYYLNAVNRVSKYAPPSRDLWTGEIYENLSVGFNATEKKLLKKVFNRMNVNYWKVDIIKRHRNISLLANLFVRGDCFFAFFWSAISILPNWILRLPHVLKKKIGV